MFGFFKYKCWGNLLHFNWWTAFSWWRNWVGPVPYCTFRCFWCGLSNMLFLLRLILIHKWVLLWNWKCSRRSRLFHLITFVIRVRFFTFDFASVIACIHWVSKIQLRFMLKQRLPTLHNTINGWNIINKHFNTKLRPQLDLNLRGLVQSIWYYCILRRSWSFYHRFHNFVQVVRAAWFFEVHWCSFLV